ncbi:transcriptional regulator, TetR family [Roseovarius pacificus]|uniref:Transcriptional regulator, TetR family n=1 Tax=Roseovarius pacificus TaxID=337701 RepID=A0A1M7K3I9_9RHOB|nr:transcriptional regulator, TetR family [Roseovarius pacificus]
MGLFLLRCAVRKMWKSHSLYAAILRTDLFFRFIRPIHPMRVWRSVQVRSRGMLQRPNDVSEARPKGARERILQSAYRLFSSRGTSQVGIDTILADSGCAKASLYKHFRSKEELVLAFLEMREDVWTHDWLEAEVRKRTAEPAERLLAIFDVFDEWFRKRDYEGCGFINILLECEMNSPIHRAAARHLANIRSIVSGFAQDAGLERPQQFSEMWHILMKGSIISAYEGNREAAGAARTAAEAALAAWPRKAQPAVA